MAYVLWLLAYGLWLMVYLTPYALHLRIVNKIGHAIIEIVILMAYGLWFMAYGLGFMAYAFGLMSYLLCINTLHN